MFQLTVWCLTVWLQLCYRKNCSRDACRFDTCGVTTLKNVYYRPKTSNTQHTARPTAVAAHHQETQTKSSSSSVSAWDVPNCQLSLPDLSTPNFKLQSKNWHVRRITMYRHLTCPDEFWHVSDTRIGPVSNPAHIPSSETDTVRRPFIWQAENRWTVETLETQNESQLGQPEEVWDQPPMGNQSRERGKNPITRHCSTCVCNVCGWICRSAIGLYSKKPFHDHYHFGWLVSLFSFALLTPQWRRASCRRCGRDLQVGSVVRVGRGRLCG